MTHFLVAIVATGLAAVLFARFSAGADHVALRARWPGSRGAACSWPSG